jgi:hypothetical protein
MEGLEENEASQKADYMAESESGVGEADMEIEAHVCNFLTIDISCISLCLGIKRLSPLRQKKRCSNSNSMLSA